MRLPWICPDCGTVHTHPSAGCRHCGREMPEEEAGPIFRLGESEDAERPHQRGGQKASPKPKPRAGSGKRR
jgi:hypothetical protein